MNKNLLIGCIALGSFLSGFAVNHYFVSGNKETGNYKKVTGIGGIFFKCKDPVKLKEWYSSYLGFNINPYGAVFEWRQGADSSQKGFSQWSPFKETTTYFAPSNKEFMINYRVGDLDKLLADLKMRGVTITDTIETYDYGKFVHIMDPEGNKIELWEPVDKVYEKMGVDAGFKTIK